MGKNLDDDKVEFNGKLDSVYKVLKLFVKDECIGSDFGMLDDKQMERLLKSWWHKNKIKFKK